MSIEFKDYGTGDGPYRSINGDMVEDDQFAELRIRCIAVERRLESVQHTLSEAKRKLRGYRSLHGPEPVSGMEYDALMEMIDDALKP